MVGPLTHKLLRDLWRMKGQAAAIAAVIAVGVLLLVMQSGLVTSLQDTRDAYYDRYRMADVFAPVARAPGYLETRLADIPGVAAAYGRVTGSALIDVADRDLPVQARAVSVPDHGEPPVNGYLLVDGRHLDTRQEDEILLLNSFAVAHGLHPGDSLSATMNGARRIFHIVGLAQAPEFLYVTAPGEIIPDDARFGVIWMSRAALSAAYDMQGAFNEALLTLSRNANEAAVIDATDRLLDPFGGHGAYGRGDHQSDRFVTEEITGLRATSRSVPPIFLGVAAFLLYIVMTRIIQSEREEIGLMKAFGYFDREVAAHYLHMILAIAGGGAVIGAILGVLAGRLQVQVYLEFYKFPFLVFRIAPGAVIWGVGVSVLVASLGGLAVLARVFRLTPAAAMRPPAPPDYSRTGRIGAALNRYLDQPSRMVLRRLTRQPVRMAGSTVGIACGMGLSVAMITLMASFDETIDYAFTISDRSDLNVSFTHALDRDALYALRRMNGVIEVEPVRHVPVVFHNGLNSYQGALSGLVSTPSLYRAVARDDNPITIREDGVIIGGALADILNIEAGDTLTVEMRTGRRATLDLPVVGIALTRMGAPAYMELSAMNRAIGEPGRVSGAYLRIDPDHASAIYRQLSDMPAVAGVVLKAESRDAFQQIMDTGAGAVRYVMAIIAGVITFGVVYNAARIAYAERSRDLASLRVVGFTRAETSFVLLGELVVVTLLAIPLGTGFGFGLAWAVSEAFSNDIYQISAWPDAPSIGSAAAAVLASAAFSGLLVKRQIDKADLVLALKTRE
ncbi:ABC transporter permease [Nioella nitratireducens]|uniref:ABC transporter permease n=1 Tax=Nioella nitratireducens TaxID=1287720 RepID=UPI0008FD4EB5|nr:ABC transporter permease [Nioella nitratireducens]